MIPEQFSFGLEHLIIQPYRLREVFTTTLYSPYAEHILTLVNEGCESQVMDPVNGSYPTKGSVVI